MEFKLSKISLAFSCNIQKHCNHGSDQEKLESELALVLEPVSIQESTTVSNK